MERGCSGNKNPKTLEDAVKPLTLFLDSNLSQEQLGQERQFRQNRTPGKWTIIVRRGKQNNIAAAWRYLLSRKLATSFILVLNTHVG